MDTGDEAEAPDEGQPEPVDMPASWSKEDAETWSALPADAQAKIAEREGQREQAVNAKFQESANGDRVFFIEKDSQGRQAGNNVFIATNEQGKETITSAQSGRVEVIGTDKFLILENGQRLEKTVGKPELTMKILISNDDGYQAPGIVALYEALKDLGQIGRAHV